MMKKEEDAAVSVREAVAGLWRKGAALAWDVPAGPTAGPLPDQAPEISTGRRSRCWAALSSAACSASYEAMWTRRVPLPLADSVFSSMQRRTWTAMWTTLTNVSCPRVSAAD